jgi:hypothetical protein
MELDLDCLYHRILYKVNENVWNRIESKYDWDCFFYWLGDESVLGKKYVDTFQEYMDEELTEDQINLLTKKGDNLEKMIAKWCEKWHEKYPIFQTLKMPKECLKLKIFEYIMYQFKKPDITSIIGTC